MFSGPIKPIFIQVYAYLTAILVIALSPFSASALRVQWQVFGLSYPNQSNIFCSATLVKKAGACRILTSAHCLKNEDQKIVLKNESKAVLTQTDVLAIDRTKDLAWLEPNQNFLNNRCSQIDEIGNQQMQGRGQLSMPYMSYGVLNSGLKVYSLWKNSAKDVWDPAVLHKPIEMKLVLRGHPGLEYMVSLKPVELEDGMSGGVLTDDRGIFLGINSQYNPAQDTSYFIPVEEVVKYISAPSDNRHVAVQGLSRFRDSGGNNHGNSTGGTKRPNSWQDILKEMDEGVILPDGRTLIGRGGYSVDGVDRYALTEKLVSPIFRENDGYPNEATRRNIFNRLSGAFRPRADLTTYMKAYKILPSSPFINRSQPEMQIEQVIYLNVSSSKIIMTFPFGVDRKGQEQQIVWNISASNDYKQIFLDNPKSKLICQNNNYLKLICRNEEEELSIASPMGFQKIEYRYYKKIAADLVFFMYGELYDPKRLYDPKKN